MSPDPIHPFLHIVLLYKPTHVLFSLSTRCPQIQSICHHYFDYHNLCSRGPFLLDAKVIDPTKSNTLCRPIITRAMALGTRHLILHLQSIRFSKLFINRPKKLHLCIFHTTSKEAGHLRLIFNNTESLRSIKSRWLSIFDKSYFDQIFSLSPSHNVLLSTP